jgi:hypothetical protein
MRVVLSAADAAVESAELELDTAVSLSEHIRVACELLGLDERPADEVALLAPRSNFFLSAEVWLEDGIPPWLREGDELEVVTHPTLEVADVLEQLRADESADPDAREQKKRRVYWLRRRLMLGEWTEEFVAQDGLTVLLELLGAAASGVGAADVAGSALGSKRNLVATADGSALQGYCLLALRQALCWQCAMAQLCASPELAYVLCSLLYSPRLKTVSHALELLFVCCSATGSLPDSSVTCEPSRIGTRPPPLASPPR